MPRLTRLSTVFTTRKHASLLALSVLALAGCSTPGPTHAYLAANAENPIIDILPGKADSAVPTYLGSYSILHGFAYDPFTDHLFLRVSPGNFVQVVDRPAKRIKRSFVVPSLPPGAGDLAIRSFDRHLFFAHPSEPSIFETNLHGEFVRTIVLEEFQGPVSGVAYDQKNDHLLILKNAPAASVITYDLKGKPLGAVQLDRAINPSSLAYDSRSSEYYVPLADTTSVGIFDRKGSLVRTISDEQSRGNTFVDVGQRSMVRMF